MGRSVREASEIEWMGVGRIVGILSLGEKKVKFDPIARKLAASANCFRLAGRELVWMSTAILNLAARSR
jgi:hypothetical protein